MRRAGLTASLEPSSVVHTTSMVVDVTLVLCITTPTVLPRGFDSDTLYYTKIPFSVLVETLTGVEGGVETETKAAGASAGENNRFLIRRVEVVLIGVASCTIFADPNIEQEVIVQPVMRLIYFCFYSLADFDRTQIVDEMACLCYFNNVI